MDTQPNRNEAKNQPNKFYKLKIFLPNQTRVKKTSGRFI
jgi:hypothetical protein